MDIVSNKLSHMAGSVWIRSGALRALRDGNVAVEALDAREVCVTVGADVDDVASGPSGNCSELEFG